MIKTPLSTVIGGAFWTPGATILGSSSKNLTQLIKSLFSLGEQGFAYDPNDLSTLYQDAAGTIPVTTAGQPVGLMKDKSGRNNHAYQTVSASRPILQQTPILGNELVVNGDFSSGLTNVAPRNEITTEIVSGTLKVTNIGTYYGFAEMALPTEIGKTYLFRGDVVASSGTGAAFHIASVINSNDIANNVEGSTAAVGVMFTAKTANTYLSLKSPSNATGSWRIFDNISVREVTGYRTDQNYLKFDGVDDFLQTNNIDFTATDKVSLFAGVRKLSDANTGIVAELSASSTNTPSTFTLYAPAGTDNKGFGFRSRGTSVVHTNGDALSLVPISPVTAVISGIGSITPSDSKLRINGVVSAVSTLTQGTGNYGNYPLYIGRRGGTSIPFNGYLYSLIGIGRLTSDSETIALEKAIAKNTGVTLNV